jgi:glycosyltransferase involved in cell wall biosynthesis
MLQNGLSIVQGLRRLWTLLRREKFDVIETFTHDSNMLALPLAWAARVPIRIATHHGIVAGIPRWRENLHAWMINSNFAQHIVAVSGMTRQKLLEEGIQAQRIIVIQNGIAPLPLEGVNKSEVRKEAEMEADDLVLLAVGRLVYSKAHEILIAAMPAVLQKFPNAKVGICGDGVLRAKLEAQIKSLGLSDSVKLLGESDHVAKFLASADIFVLPSLWEGLPIALLEAMSAGLPVISTKVEGVEEVIVEGENGLLVPIGNSAALADAITQLLADPQLRHKMGASSKAKVLEFYTVDRMCEQYLKLMLK